MNRIQFVFGVHNHQPVGNFGFVYERAYQQAYRPWLEVLARHPRIKWHLHCSGNLWEWLQQRHPEYLHGVKRQVEAGRLELLSGGFYEPILAAIPPEDQVAQIRRLNRFLQRTFGVRPRGMWLAERVWEPSLPVPMAEAGVGYTLVDDTHFMAAGVTEEALHGAFITEDRGVAVRLLPISQRLRYAIPFREPEVAIQYLARWATPEATRVVVMVDDGEKFGLWPETSRHVYEDHWLERFLQRLEHEAGWLETITCREYLERVPPQGRIYLPTVAYSEMSEWTLPIASQRAFRELAAALPSLPHGETLRPFLRGGIWRNFLTKYPEGNNLHKKMWRVSAQIHAMARANEHARASRRSPRPAPWVRPALAALHAGQCNDAYWHGIFGGLYLPHLRRAVYRQLLDAEARLPSGRSPGRRVQRADFDQDGRDELLIEGPDQNLYLSPHHGGTLFEWDLKPFRVNLGDVLARWEEVYHREVEGAGSGAAPAASPERVKTIHERTRVVDPAAHAVRGGDVMRRVSLMDRFLPADTRRQDLWEGRFQDAGDFVQGDYHWMIRRGATPAVTFSRRGIVRQRDRVIGVQMAKVIESLPGMGWTVTYRLQPLEEPPVGLWFAVECNWAFSEATPQDQDEQTALTQWERPDRAGGFTLQVTCHPAAGVWTFPVETVSTSEQGFEGIYQGTAVVFHWAVMGPPREWQTFTLRAEVTPLL